MRLLVLYRDNPDYRYDEWLHMGFVKAMNKEVCSYAYGPGLFELYPMQCIVAYNEKLTMADLYDIFKFEAIVCIAKGRMFHYYDPRKPERNDSWLPSDFITWDATPKIVLEEDYHYERDDFWYAYNGINLILQRHKSNVKPNVVPMKFFPFSVDTDLFFPADEFSAEVKERMIFMGGKCSQVYPFRYNALNLLQKYDIIDERRVCNESYPEVLRNYRAGLSCGSAYDIFPAKVLEILSCGLALVTNKFSGCPSRLGNIFYVEEDCSNLISQSLNAIKSRKGVETHEYIKKHHSHKVRIKQLVKEIQCLINH